MGPLGGLFPGIVLLLSTFYKRHAMQVRFAMMFSVTSLAGAFSGLLAFGIQHLNGKHGISGWQWIFIIVRRSRHLLSSAFYASLTASLRREPSPLPLGWLHSVSSLPRPEISGFSPRRSVMYIAETLPTIGVAMPTLMANMLSCSVGMKSQASSQTRLIFF
jgi:hypothetical protein